MPGLTIVGKPAPQALIGGVLTLLTLTVLAGQVKVAAVLAAAVVAVALGWLLVRVLAQWSWLLYGLAAIDLLIPEDDRYVVRGSVGFQLEPYRVVVMLMIVGWLAALLVDPRVQSRRTKLDGPLLLIVLATLGSEIFNPGRVAATTSFVIKALILSGSLILFVYVFVSVVRTRETVERIIKVLVASGCVVAVGAAIERETRFNIFNHLHRLLPMMRFNAAAELSGLLRNGSFRAIASAGHPIELSNDMAMLTPLAAYLAIRGRRRWWATLPILLMGNLSSGSRTGIVGLCAVLVVFLCMRPRETLRCWPALIPILGMVQLIMPHAISGVISAFFPKGGLIHQQTQTFAAHGQIQYASRLSRIGPELHNVFAKHNEFFGEGWGTVQVGRLAVTSTPTAITLPGTMGNGQILDDQWLGVLLDTGLVGVAGWLWLFGRAIRRLAVRARMWRGTQQGWLPVALAGSIACYATAMCFYDAFGFIQATVMLYILLGCTAVVLWLPADGGKLGGARVHHSVPLTPADGPSFGAHLPGPDLLPEPEPALASAQSIVGRGFEVDATESERRYVPVKTAESSRRRLTAGVARPQRPRLTAGAAKRRLPRVVAGTTGLSQADRRTLQGPRPALVPPHAQSDGSGARASGRHLQLAVGALCLLLGVWRRPPRA